MFLKYVVYTSKNSQLKFQATLLTVKHSQKFQVNPRAKFTEPHAHEDIRGGVKHAVAAGKSITTTSEKAEEAWLFRLCCAAWRAYDVRLLAELYLYLFTFYLSLVIIDTTPYSHPLSLNALFHKIFFSPFYQWVLWFFLFFLVYIYSHSPVCCRCCLKATLITTKFYQDVCEGELHDVLRNTLACKKKVHSHKCNGGEDDNFILRSLRLLTFDFTTTVRWF